MASDAGVSLVSHLLARWARADGEETLLEVMLRDCVLEWGMAEGDAIEVKGRFNTSTRITMLLKVDLDAASVDLLCMVLDLDYDKAISTNQLQHWRKVFKAKSGETTPPALVLRRQDQSLPPLKNVTARSRPDHPRDPCQAQTPVRGASRRHVGAVFG